MWQAFAAAGAQHINDLTNSVVNKWLGGSDESGPVFLDYQGQWNQHFLARQSVRKQMNWMAREKGIHPLVTLGATSYSPQPVAVGQRSSSPTSIPYAPDGQALGRALSSNLTDAEKEAIELEKEYLHLRNDRAMLENMLLNKDLLNTAGNGPGEGSPPPGHSQILPGQNNAVNVVPDNVTRHHDGHTAGVHAMHQYRLGKPDNNGIIPIYSMIHENAGDAAESDLPNMTRYYTREVKDILQSWLMNKKTRTPGVYLKDYHLEWSRGYGQWVLVPRRTPGNKKSGGGGW